MQEFADLHCSIIMILQRCRPGVVLSITSGLDGADISESLPLPPTSPRRKILSVNWLMSSALPCWSANHFWSRSVSWTRDIFCTLRNLIGQCAPKDILDWLTL